LVATRCVCVDPERHWPLIFHCAWTQANTRSISPEYLDKTLINYANVMGLQDDAGISGTQFSLLAMIFYVSYLGCEFPHAYGMQILPTAKYLGAMVVLVSLSRVHRKDCK
jgi:hypothetical protein